MKLRTGCFGIIMLFCSCQDHSGHDESGKTSLPLVGTWELISGMTVEKGDTSFTDYRNNQKLIKVINNTHFAFLRHDLGKGKDSSAIFVSGGGKYTLAGNQYTEYLEYCNYREWEDNTFHFTVSIRQDTLIQSGVEKVEKLGVDRRTTEKYIRVKE